MLPVCRLWPALSTPTWLISGQSVCSGCGSDAMSCGRVSLLTNRTWLPRGTTTFFGVTALFAMVIVAAAVGLGELVDPPPLPQDAVARMPAADHAARSPTRTCSRMQIIRPRFAMLSSPQYGEGFGYGGGSVATLMLPNIVVG